MSDTSPLRALHHLKLVELLTQLYGEVWLPPAVLAELAKNYPDFPKLLSRDYAFLRVKAPTDQPQVNQLLQTLDLGEAEAIALAREIQADLVLIDELDGRSMAQSLGLNVTGVLGVLSRAKREGLIGAARPLLDSLEHELGFFLGTELKERVLRALGE